MLRLRWFSRWQDVGLDILVDVLEIVIHKESPREAELEQRLAVLWRAVTGGWLERTRYFIPTPPLQAPVFE